MLRDRLIPELKQRYPDAAFDILDTPRPFARLDSRDSEIGALEIYDDGDEATVSIVEITHGHFDDHDAVTESEREQSIAESLLYFLDALFDDRVLLFRSRDRRQGGWQVFDDRINKRVPAQEFADYECFVWSGRVGADG